MKTRNEITNKIDSLMALLEKEKERERRENICCQIDALLWVIGDASGAPLLDNKEYWN